jgi:hypothetical protein
MTDDTIALFSFPAVAGKKVTAAFDGGRLSSDGGVMLLSMAERRLGVAERLARCIPDRRDRSRIAHTIAGHRQLEQSLDGRMAVFLTGEERAMPQIWVTGWIKRRTFLASRLRFRCAILHLGQP